MKLPFEWTGFNNIDLLYWETRKEEIERKIDRYDFPVIFPTPEYLDEPNDIKWQINVLYMSIFINLECKHASEIEGIAKEIYLHIINSYLIQAEAFNGEFVYAAPSACECLSAHPAFSKSSIQEKTKSWLVLSLMMLDVFLSMDESDKGKYSFLLDANSAYWLGIRNISDAEKRTAEARNRGRARHRNSNIVKSFAINSARELIHKKKQISILQVAKTISDDVKSEAGKVSFYYSPDRFDHTIYEWLLKAKKEGKLK